MRNVELFDGDDRRYLTWLSNHRDGYVLNRRRGKSDDYLGEAGMDMAPDP